MSLDAVKDWSTNATLNTTLGPSLTLDGTVMKPSDVDNAFRELMAQVAAQFGKTNFKGANIASATTTNLANATGNFVDITGTTAITGLGTVAAGQLFFLRFTGALTFTHNATSLILPGAANITTANGDIACMLSLGAGNWACAGYTYASGLSATGPAFTQTYSDNGATGGPDFVQMRESTSPAANDVLGRWWFRGRDSAGNVQDYGLIAVIIDDPTSGSEDSHFEFYNVTAGGLSLKLNLNATGINTVPIGQTTPAAGAFTSLSASGAHTAAGNIGTAVASTSGTSIDFTGIPAGARRIVVSFNGVSTNGINAITVQLGDSGGIETSGYLGSCSYTVDAAASAALNFVSGFVIHASGSAAMVIHGSMTLTLVDPATFTWVASGVFGRSDTAATMVTAGSKSTSAALDRVRITADGVNTFDAGKINIVYD
jgi:hypothetical protein